MVKIGVMSPPFVFENVQKIINILSNGDTDSMFQVQLMV